VLVQYCFDLGWIDVEAGADDQLLGAADNVQNVIFEPREIAGVKPAIAVDHRRGPFGGPIIAAHDIGTADVQFADLARRHCAAVLPDQTRLDPGDQRAYGGVIFRRLRPDSRDSGGAFGNAIAVTQR